MASVETPGYGGGAQAFYNPVAAALGALGIGKPTNFDSVSQGLASLSSAEWQQAAAAQYPLQSQLINFAENPLYAGQQASQAGTAYTNEAQTLQTNQGQQEAYQGLNLTPAQQAAQAKTVALDTAAGDAAAQNTARQGAYQNQQGALRGFS